MKVWLMWIPNSVNGESIALSPVAPVKESGEVAFPYKCNSFGITKRNEHYELFDYMFEKYVQYTMSSRDVIEIEL